jgi:DNA-directed RNA polymerase specialized sigma subunit
MKAKEGSAKAKASATENHYINNIDFYDLICKFHEEEIVSDDLWITFWKLAENYAHLKCFRGYSYIDDMKMEAMLRCVKYIRSFDHINKKNPFAYFTTVVHNSFIQFLNKEKNQQNKKWKELRVVYEQYILEHNINIKLPDNIISKMYDE